MKIEVLENFVASQSNVKFLRNPVEILISFAKSPSTKPPPFSIPLLGGFCSTMTGTSFPGCRRGGGLPYKSGNENPQKGTKILFCGRGKLRLPLRGTKTEHNLTCS